MSLSQYIKARAIFGDRSNAGAPAPAPAPAPVAVATTEENGLMSKEDKAKLDALQQISPPDPFSIESKEITIDFGVLGTRVITVDIEDEAVTSASRIYITEIYITEAIDNMFERAFDPVHLSAFCKANGIITVVATGVVGRISGLRKASYFIT